MSTAVVIPNWNSLTLLSRCLESLRQGQGAEIELLVVDNGSTDGSVEYLEREGIPHISLQKNAGFATAVNLGARRTESDTVFVLNADTIVEKGSIEVLVDALAADLRLGGVQPLILQLEDGQGGKAERPPTVYSAGQSLTRDGRGFEEGAGEVRTDRDLRRREVFGVCGAACLLRRELFSEVGGYDEGYVSFCEDVDLNVRARIAGWAFELVPEAVVWHVGNAVWQSEFADPIAENARLVARNRIATQLKYMPAAALPRIAAVECGALAKSVAEHRFRATAAGKLEGLRQFPSLRRERRQLRETGDLAAARAWLGRGRPTGSG
ncbi:MAG: glycosyltransferase family 2 protein [Solirubrobacterales bacterium]